MKRLVAPDTPSAIVGVVELALPLSRPRSVNQFGT